MTGLGWHEEQVSTLAFTLGKTSYRLRVPVPRLFPKRVLLEYMLTGTDPVDTVQVGHANRGNTVQQPHLYIRPGCPAKDRYRCAL